MNPRLPCSYALKVSIVFALVLVAKRAETMRSFRTTSAPRSLDSLSAATVTPCKRFMGPSAEIAVEGRIEPTNTIGLPQFTVASMKKADSSRVSVPWVITAPDMVGSSQTCVWSVWVRFRRRDEEMSPLLTLCAWTAAILATLKISGILERIVLIPKSPDL